MVKFWMLLICMMLLLTACSKNMDAIYQKDCQLSCLRVNMSYESHKVIASNETIADLKCQCNQYIEVSS